MQIRRNYGVEVSMAVTDIVQWMSVMDDDVGVSFQIRSRLKYIGFVLSSWYSSNLCSLSVNEVVDECYWVRVLY